jgi:hypothetical protein
VKIHYCCFRGSTSGRPPSSLVIIIFTGLIGSLRSNGRTDVASAQRDVASSDPSRRAANIPTSVLRRSQVHACCRGSGFPQSLSGQTTGGTSNIATAAWLIAFEMNRPDAEHPHNTTQHYSIVNSPLFRLRTCYRLHRYFFPCYEPFCRCSPHFH